MKILNGVSIPYLRVTHKLSEFIEQLQARVSIPYLRVTHGVEGKEVEYLLRFQSPIYGSRTKKKYVDCDTPNYRFNPLSTGHAHYDFPTSRQIFAGFNPLSTGHALSTFLAYDVGKTSFNPLSTGHAP